LWRAVPDAGRVASLAVLAWLTTLQPWLPALAVVGGIALVFALPGLAATSALFVRRALSPTERAVLIPALSLAAVVFGGLAMAAVGVPLTRTAWGGCGAATTVALSAVAYWRRRWVPRRATPTPSGDVSHGLRNLVLLMAGAAILALGSWLGMRGAEYGPPEKFTALSALPITDPDPADELRPVVLAVECRENGATSYRLRVTDDSRVQTFAIALEPGQIWKQEVEVPLTGRMTADLFLGDDEVVYRTVFVAGADE
jgi:hypothetical protein